MLVFSLAVLLWCGLLASAQEKYARISVMQLKRETASCEQTYGNGSQPCGGPESTFCFNPSNGQSCCATDSGFCGAGKYCAPVAGYCCHEGEDLATCARNAGFALPGSVSNTLSTDTPDSAQATTVGGPTLTVVPFLKESSVPTTEDIQDEDDPCSFQTSATSATPSNSTTPETNVISNTNTTTSPLVQVSLVVKRVHPSIGSMVMVGIASLLVAFF
ncbi:hypothetical protein F4776DRAFT_633596 [Hypoxylon sp. NC0597]|nr:hypothetical protein F4776DRAFT_633596 [Hypoxylon sp. NC0597]